ncbi:hypothetical protein A0H76_2086 [Hepatospora eriocheir]|uniref:Uncharacterized protein n=1 Tax=Hepatospora eriocheir TaxID=1081669 RepID=A0A1X0QFZ3_9MICR|nr:hypothetical protein A0H76_2086 [Hepatospora eriocheir]
MKNMLKIYKNVLTSKQGFLFKELQWWPKKLQYPHRLNMKTMNFETDNKLVMSSNMYKKMSL